MSEQNIQSKVSLVIKETSKAGTWLEILQKVNYIFVCKISLIFT